MTSGLTLMPDTGGVHPRVLKAIAKARSWRRKLESGEAATIQDIAEAEGVSDRYVANAEVALSGTCLSDVSANGTDLRL